MKSHENPFETLHALDQSLSEAGTNHQGAAKARYALEKAAQPIVLDNFLQIRLPHVLSLPSPAMSRTGEVLATILVIVRPLRKSR